MEGEKITKCLTCGGDLAPDNSGIPTCIYCGRQNKDAAGGFSHELEEIVKRRQLREFIQAEELCRELQSKQPENAEVYWQTMLATLGVVYVQEGGKAKPTFFSYSYDDRDLISNNSNFQNAVKYAKTTEERKYYESQAQVLDSLLKEFFSLVAKEDSYDIFISFKKSFKAMAGNEEVSVDTNDYRKAEEIYNHLKDTYRVFFSPVSIGKDTGIEGEKYEPRILKALQTSQAMILLGSKTEYLEGQWVQNEWRRYLYFIDKGKKKSASLILGYQQAMPPLPPALKDVQWPNFDWFKDGYLKVLDEKLAFVKSSKGLKSMLKARKVNSNFDTDADLDFGYTGKRVSISGKGYDSIVLSASDERELALAESALQAKQFSGAKNLFNNLIKKNPNNAQAYWGRFKARIKAEKDGQVQHRITAPGTEEYFDDIDKAIDCSNDESFSWRIVDCLIDALRTGAEWKHQSKVFEFLLKYLDDKRVGTVLGILSKKATDKLGTNVQVAEAVFESSRKLFFEENKSKALKHMREFADALYEKKHFDKARKYYEEIASVKKDGEVYMRLLGCRLKAVDVTQTSFSLDIDSDDDASSKKPSELDLDEIIERAVICADSSRSSKVDDQVQEMVFFQAANNTKNVKPFIETVVSCYDQLEKGEKAQKFLLNIADLFIRCKKFKYAQEYCNEVLSRDQNCSRAHWGLLMCRFKAVSEAQLAEKREKLLDLPEYTNAVSCASESEFRHYTDILNGDVSTATGPTTLASVDTKAKTVKADFATFKTKEERKKARAERASSIVQWFFLLLPTIVLTGAMAISMIMPTLIFGFIHYGWVITIYIGVTALMIGLSIYCYNEIIGILGYEGKKLAIAIIAHLAGLAMLIVRLTTLSSSTVEIASVYDFNAIDNMPMAEKYVLTADIDFEGGELYPIEELPDFSTFDGKGHVIKNYVVKEGFDVSDDDYTYQKYTSIGAAGLVGVCRGTIKDLILQNGKYNIELENENSYSGNGAFGYGPVCGILYGGELNNCKVLNCGYDLSKVKNYWNVEKGSVCGWNHPNKHGKITNCGVVSLSSNGCIVDSIIYELKGDEAMVAGSLSAKENIKIPSTFKDSGKTYTVTGIASGAFADMSKLKSIVIPDSVTYIGNGAFKGCSGLTSITLPFVGDEKDKSNNTHFGYIFGASGYSVNNSFVPSGLTTVTITGGKYIYERAFYGCKSITSVVIPESVERIANEAFYACSNLATVHWNATACRSVGMYYAPIFSNCDKLTKVVLGDNVRFIPEYAFNGCSDLEYTEYENCRYLGSAKNPHFALISALDSPADTYTINGETKVIADCVFYGKEISSIEIPNSVVAIGNRAFSHCSYLTSVTIGSGVTYIGDEAFRECGVEAIELPDSVTHIGVKAFYYSKRLETVRIGNGVTHIGEEAFSGCDDLRSVTMGSSVTDIGDYAFNNCVSLTTIDIPASVTHIGNYAFYGCSQLENVNFKNTEDWWYASWVEATSGIDFPSEALADPEVAADYLTWEYYEYHWRRGGKVE
ncbi:MAG: leucine-rich repeat protein [Clostridiales bacterium]|nr:leucine-rich repeat protein [Clostridiales bacterium]